MFKHAAEVESGHGVINLIGIDLANPGNQCPVHFAGLPP
jgi:hypothetical protein